MNEPEGLRLYREHCEMLMPEEVRGYTWPVRSHWVAMHIPAEKLEEIYVQAMRDFVEGHATDDGIEESLYVVLDILWHAIPEAARKRAKTMFARLR